MYACSDGRPIRVPAATVPLTGTLDLTRDPTTGLITKYKETWDTDVVATLSKAYL